MHLGAQVEDGAFGCDAPALAMVRHRSTMTVLGAPSEGIYAFASVPKYNSTTFGSFANCRPVPV